MQLKEKKSYKWVVVLLLSVVALLNYLDRQMLSTMQPSMKMDIEALKTAANFGRLMAVFLWIYGLMSPFSGIIADRLNRKWLITGSLFIWSLVTLLMGFATGFTELYILRAVMGISEALYIPAALSLIADYHSSKTRSLAVGIHMTGLYMGQFFGGYGDKIADRFSWQTTFHWLGIAGIIYAIILILFLREHRTVQTKNEPSGEKKNPFSGLGVLLKSTAFWVLLFYFAVPSLPGWAIKNWLPTLFANFLKIDMSVAGPMATAALTASSFLGVLIGGVLSDKWVRRSFRGRVYISAIGIFLTIPALFLLAYGVNVYHLLTAAFCFGFGFGMFDANNMPILCQFVAPRYRATGYGVMNMMGVFSGAIITDILGKSADAGSLKGDFAVLAVIVFAVLIVQLTFLKPKTVDYNNGTEL